MFSGGEEIRLIKGVIFTIKVKGHRFNLVVKYLLFTGGLYRLGVKVVGQLL